MQFGMGSHVEGIDNGITLSTVKSRDGVIWNCWQFQIRDNCR